MSRILGAYKHPVTPAIKLVLLMTLTGGALLATACGLQADDTPAILTTVAATKTTSVTPTAAVADSNTPVTPPTAAADIIPSATAPNTDLSVQDVPVQDINAYTDCDDDSDCVIVARDCCGNAAAINTIYLDQWEQYLEASKSRCAKVVCKETPPLDFFKGRCLGNKCLVREAECGAEIEDPGTYSAAVLVHPTVAQLNRELNLLQIEVTGVCVMDGKVDLLLRYEIPEAYSSHKVTYSADLMLRYHVENGSLEPGYDPSGLNSVQVDAILAHYRHKIQQVEADSRVAEFLTKAGWDPLLGRVYLSRGDVKVQGTNGFIVFTYPYDSPVGLVTEYYVPNAVEWERFPELTRAHQIIQEALLAKKRTDCSISREGRAYVGTLAHRIGWEETDAWSLQVYLVCGDQWKEAVLQLNADDSYSVLELP